MHFSSLQTICKHRLENVQMVGDFVQWTDLFRVDYLKERLDTDNSCSKASNTMQSSTFRLACGHRCRRSRKVQVLLRNHIQDQVKCPGQTYDVNQLGFFWKR